jgi:hypothetical protein
MLLLLILALLPISPARAGSDCADVLTVLQTRSNAWEWTRDSFDGLKSTPVDVHLWEWIYRAPLTVISAPGDLIAMPFRRKGIFVRGSLHGTVSAADGRVLTDYPWKNWPWKYQDHPGLTPFKGAVHSYHRPCTAASPCRADETETSQFEFGTDAAGGFVLTFEGFVVKDGYLEVSFPAPIDRAIRIVRRADRLAAIEPSGESLCRLSLRSTR